MDQQQSSTCARLLAWLPGAAEFLPGTWAALSSTGVRAGDPGSLARRTGTPQGGRQPPASGATDCFAAPIDNRLDWPLGTGCGAATGGATNTAENKPALPLPGISAGQSAATSAPSMTRENYTSLGVCDHRRQPARVSLIEAQAMAQTWSGKSIISWCCSIPCPDRHSHRRLSHREYPRPRKS